MPTNKRSVWSTIILVTTILSLILLALSITLMSLALPSVQKAAYDAAMAQPGMTQADAELIATIAVGGVVAAVVASSVLDVFRIIGGFFFSLKGRWGIFCIVVSIISVALGLWSLISNIVNKAPVGNIVVDGISLAVAALFCVACFKHRAENKAA